MSQRSRSGSDKRGSRRRPPSIRDIRNSLRRLSMGLPRIEVVAVPEGHDVEQEELRRPSPEHNVIATLALTQLLCGLGYIILAVLMVVEKQAQYLLGTAMWAGLVFIVGGVVGLATYKTRDSCYLTAYMIVSIIASILTPCALTFACLGLTFRKEPADFNLITVAMIAFTVVENIAALISSMFSCKMACCAKSRQDLIYYHVPPAPPVIPPPHHRGLPDIQTANLLPAESVVTDSTLNGLNASVTPNYASDKRFWEDSGVASSASAYSVVEVGPITASVILEENSAAEESDTAPLTPPCSPQDTTRQVHKLLYLTSNNIEVFV